MPREQFWKKLFFGLSLARLLSLIPFVVDDDEAWWSVAARSISSPFEYYFRAVDHKPPGIVWFVKLFGSDPRISRFFFSLLVMFAGLAIGKIAFWFKQKQKGVDWRASCLFLFALVVGTPKLLTVTADGVLVLFVVLAYFVALTSTFTGASVVAGALLGCALLVKQTAVFFAIPILFARWPRKWSFREILAFALGASIVYLPVVLLMDWREFFYWNWTYPREVLTRARGTAFNLIYDTASNCFYFIIVLLPLYYFALKSKVKNWLQDFRILWLTAAFLGTFLGRGIFLHYFLLIAPPLALLAAEGWQERKLPVVWLMTGYAFGCVVIAFPYSGLFWGNDAQHAELVGQKIDQIGNLVHDHSVMVWGGSSLPLAYSKGEYSGRFLLPRFAEPPYDTERTQSLFHDELAAHPPVLIVDLHERGDNRFDNEFVTDSFVSVRADRDYRLFIDPTLPWAKFYLRTSVLPQDLIPLHLESVNGADEMKRVYSKFPAHDGEWNFFAQDQRYRTLNALELIELQSQNTAVQSQANLLTKDFDLQKAQTFLRQQDPEQTLLPLRSPLWWPEVAIVELQPKLFSGKK